MSKYKKTAIITVNNTAYLYKGDVLQIKGVCNALVVSVIDTKTLRVALRK